MIRIQNMSTKINAILGMTPTFVLRRIDPKTIYQDFMSNKFVNINRKSLVHKNINVDTPIISSNLLIPSSLSPEDETYTYQDSNNKWRWRRTAPNGEIVGASTQGYANKNDCKKNAIRNGCDIDD